jgi:hypothetical protein
LFDHGVSIHESQTLKTPRRPGQPSEEQKRHARKKENSPFDKQGKHGRGAHRRSPGNAEEYQGNPTVQRSVPEAEEDKTK